MSSYIINIFKELVCFISSGYKTFRDAASGKYDGDSDAVKDIRSDIFRNRTALDDCHNLKNDRKNISKDIRNSFNINR